MSKNSPLPVPRLLKFSPGDGVAVQKSKVYLYNRASNSKTKSQASKVAESIDGLNFIFYKTSLPAVIKSPVIPPKIKSLLHPRPLYFDDLDIEIQNVFRIGQKYIVFYHVRPDSSTYRVGYAILNSKKQLIERTAIPIWESLKSWQGEQVTFIGLVHHRDIFISYWDVGNLQIYSVVYPSFKLRQPVFTSISPKLSRPDNNPIILPRSDNSWESSQTFNPGVILLDDRFRFLYRAIGEDGVSRLGYAVSEDGFTINDRLPHPVYIHQTLQPKSPTFDSFASGGSWGGAEDPRLVRVGDEPFIYMTYTACDGGLRVGFSSIRVDDFINGRWNWSPSICISPPGKINKNWMIFPEKIHGQYAILHAITPKIHIEYFDNLEFDGQTYINNSVDPQAIPDQSSSWDKRLRGAGSPPIRTKHGWLMFYHAMDYKVGAMLLDLDNPTKILCRSKEPVLQSIESYEYNGFKPGVVYVSGAVVKDGTLYVYYGGADSYVCVATADLDQFLTELKQQQPVLLESAIINKVG